MSYQAEVLADVPALYLPMQEISGTTLNDVSGNGLHFALTGSYTLGVPGPQESVGVAFNGGYASRADNALFDWSGDFAVEYWFWKDGAPSEQQPVVEKNGAALTTFWNSHITTPLGSVRYNRTVPSDGADQSYESPEVSRCDAQWHHAVMSRDGNEIRSYVDTDLGRVDSPVTHDFSNSAELVIANRWDHHAPASFIGRLAHLAIYQHALSEEDIDRHVATAKEGWGMLI